jgi:hypothetical protein
MTKRFGFILVALMILSALLAACGSKSNDAAKDYFKAVLKGDLNKAQDNACDSFQDDTATLVAAFAALDIQNIDVQFDEGKGGNQEEVIVTGSFDVGSGDDADEIELAQTYRDNDGEDYNTRVVLDMKKDGDDWCVEGIDVNELWTVPELGGAAAVEEEVAPVVTEEAPAPVVTEEAAPVATEEVLPEATEAAE